jgi:hypothetical protein
VPKNKYLKTLDSQFAISDDSFAMRKGYSKADVAKELKRLQGKMTQREFSAVIGISQPYLTDLLLGNRWPGKKILDYLAGTGLELEPGFIRKPKRAA